MNLERTQGERGSDVRRERLNYITQIPPVTAPRLGRLDNDETVEFHTDAL